MVSAENRKPLESTKEIPADSTAQNSDPEPDAESVARAIALRKLAAAPQTKAQLDEAMAKRGVPDDIREHVLQRFTEVGLIDDAAFANAWVHSRHSGRGLGKRALAHELRRKGVAAETVSEAVESVTAESEEEAARRLVARKLPGIRRLPPDVQTRRLAGMLARKGYPASLAFRVVRDAVQSGGEGDDLPEGLSFDTEP